MLEKQSTDNTASEQSAAMNSEAAFLAAHSRGKKDSQPSAEASTETPAGENQPAATQEENVLSKLLKELDGASLENLPEDQVAALAEKLRSKSLSRFGELTKRAKTAEEQLAELRQEQEKGFQSKAKPEANPYANVSTVEDLEKEFHKLKGHVEWAEALLEDNDGAHAEDVVYTDGSGREYTKSAIRQSLRDARKAKDIYINEQYKQIVQRQERRVLRDMAAEKAASELPWMKGDDNDTRRQYQALKERVKFDAIEQADPEFAIELEAILAHAANSMFAGKKPAGKDGKPPPALTPPSSPSSSGAPLRQSNPQADKSLREIEERFAKTNSSDDYAALIRARRAARNVR